MAGPDTGDKSGSSKQIGRLSPDERAEHERRLGKPFALDGSFGSLWAIELLLRTVRRVPSFRPLVSWARPYLRNLLTRGYRESGFSLLDIDERLISVQEPGFVSNLDEAFGRMLSQQPPTAALSPIFGMALAPRYGLEAVTLGQPWLDDRIRHRPAVERIIDWLVAEHLRTAIGDDRELGAAGYDVVRTLLAPSCGYLGSDGSDQVKKVEALLTRQRNDREQVLRGLCASQDLYMAVIAGQACSVLGVVPSTEQEARGVRRALQHFRDLPGARVEVLQAVTELLPAKESPVEGIDHPDYARADACARAGQMQAAWEILDELITQAPQRAAYWCYRGHVAERIGRDSEQSYEDYDRAISLQPDYWQALINRGVLLSRNRRYDDADRDFMLVCVLRPDCGDTRNNLLLNYLFRRREQLGFGPEAGREASADRAAEHRARKRARAAEETRPPKNAAEPAAEHEKRKDAAQPRALEPPKEQAPSSSLGSAGGGAGRKQIVDDDGGDWHLYEVIEPLGAGGMGKVYRVHHLGWGIDLALKIPRVELLERGGVEGFVEEAEAWSRLGVYPHTVDCYYVRMRSGAPWLFAELVDGGSLADWIDKGKFRRAKSKTDQQLLASMIDVALQMSYGLHHAHRHGLIHQDMKPANVMLTKTGIAKVTDFGLAKTTRLAEPAAESSKGGRHKTLMAGYAGMTPVFCSPEQAAAARKKDVELTRRTDVWSWAVTVLHMFTGEIRWMSGVLAPHALRQYLDDGGWDERIPMMPPRLVGLLQHCFARDPNERPTDMLEIAATLRSIYVELSGARQARPDPAAHEEQAVVHNNRGASMLDIGRNSEALSAWKQALDAEPHHLEASYNLALIEWRNGDITDEQAVERMRAATSSHAMEWRAHLMQAWLHYERADRKRAQACCVRALTGTARTEATMKRVAGPYHGTKAGFQLERLTELPSPPHALSTSRDERVVASAHHDGVRVWMLAGGTSLQGAKINAQHVALSTNGSVAAAANAESIIVWKTAATDSQRINMPGVTGLALCNEHQLAAAVGKRIVLIDVDTGQNQDLGTHGGRVNSVTAMADGHLLASASDDATVTLRLLDGKVTRTLRHELAVDWVALTADARRAVSGGWDAERSHYRLSIWDAVSGSLVRRLEEPAPRRAVMSDDGRHVLSWSSSGTLRLWHVDSGRCLRRAAPLDDVHAIACADADPVLVAAGGHLHLVQVLHDAPAAPIMVARPRHSDVLELQHQRFRAALGRTEGALKLGDLPGALLYLAETTAVPGYRRHRDAQALATRIAHRTTRGVLRSSWAGRSIRDLGGPVQAVGLAPDGDSVTSVMYDAGRNLIEVRRHDTMEGKQRAVMHVVEPKRPFEAAAIAADASVVATACGGNVRIWRIDQGHSQLLAGKRHPSALRWSRDGRLLFVAGQMGITIWDTAAERWLDPVGCGAVQAMAPAAEADAMAVVAGDGALSLWVLGARQELRQLSDAAADVEQLRITPSASMTAMLDGNSTLITIDAEAGVVKGDLTIERASTLALSDDGGLVAIGDSRGGVHLHALNTPGKLVRLGSHNNVILSLAFTPDGRLLASGGRDGDLRLWHVEHERVLPSDTSLRRAAPWLKLFLRAQRPAEHDPLIRIGIPSWTNAELEHLGRRLGWLGFGRHTPKQLEDALQRLLDPKAFAEQPEQPGSTVLQLREEATDRIFEVGAGPRRLIGRAQDCDIVLRRPLVAHHHAMLSVDERGAKVIDAGSRIGIELDGQPVRGEATLEDGAMLRIGITRLLVKLQHQRAAAPPRAFELSRLPMRLQLEQHRAGQSLGRREPLPLSLLVLGAIDTAHSGAAATEQPLVVTDVDSAMATLKPQLQFSMPANEALALPASNELFAPTCLADLAPGKLAQQLGDTAKMYFSYIGLGWWETIIDDFATQLAALLPRLGDKLRAGQPAGSTALSAANEIAEVYGRAIISRLVPTDHPAYAVARGTLAGMLHVLVSHGRNKIDREEVVWAKQTIARGVAKALDQILFDPRMRQHERCWRSLASLQAAMPDADCRLHLLACGSKGPAAVINNGALRRALMQAYAQSTPYGAIVMADPIDDPALLTAAATIARQSQAGLIAGTTPEARRLLQTAPSNGWRAFFADPASSHVALLGEQLSLREPYAIEEKMPYVEGAVSGRQPAPIQSSGAIAAAQSLLRGFESRGLMALDIDQIATEADTRSGARSFRSTFPMGRLAQHLRLMHLGSSRRDDTDACRAWLQYWLDTFTKQLSDASGTQLRGALQLTEQDQHWLRCDLWLGPQDNPAAAASSCMWLRRTTQG